MSVREKIEELTRMRHVADGNTDAEHLEYMDKVASARCRIRTPDDLAAYLRFLAVDMEKSSHPMETSQWEFLQTLADVIDEDLDELKTSESAWSSMAKACEDAVG